MKYTISFHTVSKLTQQGISRWLSVVTKTRQCSLFVNYDMPVNNSVYANGGQTTTR